MEGLASLWMNSDTKGVRFLAIQVNYFVGDRALPRFGEIILLGRRVVQSLQVDRYCDHYPSGLLLGNLNVQFFLILIKFRVSTRLFNRIALVFKMNLFEVLPTNMSLAIVVRPRRRNAVGSHSSKYGLIDISHSFFDLQALPLT